MATAERWERLSALFDAALALPPATRSAWLAENCADAALRAEVQKLLSADARASELLDRSAGQHAERLVETRTDPEMQGVIGRVFGQFRILKAIGQGGMASVFLAERIGADFEQKAALKLLRRGLYAPEEQKLFRRERQILAKLHHPNIARVIDGGLSGEGIPFLIIEYVDGRPITEHCANERLDVRARLTLFVTVCRTVQAAHQALVVHRDLKPSNILVGNDGNLKLLDFGIAKLIDEDSVLGGTATLTPRLTPGYAAPEQFIGGPITTTTDVYALGVLLAELLTGRRPPRDKSTRGVAPAPAATPGSGDDDGTLRHLHGELDTIVRKAMAAEAWQRYHSADALADDIERWLAGLPINARPDSWRYRFGKFLRRHRLAVGFASLAIVALLSTAAVSVQQALRADRQALIAHAEARRANAVREFLLELFSANVPGVPLEQVPTTAELLSRGSKRALLEFADTPALKVDLLTAISSVQQSLGGYLNAEALAAEAVDTAEAQLASDDPIALAAATQQASLWAAQSRYREANQALSAALARYREQGGADNDEWQQALQQLGRFKTQTGEGAAAVVLLRESLVSAERRHGRLHARVQIAVEHLAEALMSEDRLEEAVPMLRRNLLLTRQLFGPRHLAISSALEALGTALNARDELAEAEALLLEAVAINRAVLKHPHQMKGFVFNTLGNIELKQGKIDQARQHFGAALAVHRLRFGPHHTQVAASLHNLGTGADAAGDLVSAEDYYRRAADLALVVRGDPMHVQVITLQHLRIDVLERLGRQLEAAALRASMPPEEAAGE